MNRRIFFKSLIKSVVLVSLSGRLLLKETPSLSVTTLDWTEDQITAYNAMPFYLAKMPIDRTEYRAFDEFISKSKWNGNMRSIKRIV